MANPLDQLAQIVTGADAPDGWRVRTRANVEVIEQRLGLPLAQRVAAAGLAVLNGHGHADKPSEDAQFVFWEPFGLPSKQLPNVERFLEKTDVSGQVSKVADGNAYLAVVVGHRWEHSTKRPGYEGHVRWGFFLEGKDKKTEQAQPVLSGAKLRDRVLRFRGAAEIAYLARRPLPGINARTGPVGLWLSGLGRSVNGAELRGFGSLDGLLDVIEMDLRAIYRALSDEA